MISVKVTIKVGWMPWYYIKISSVNLSLLTNYTQDIVKAIYFKTIRTVSCGFI